VKVSKVADERRLDGAGVRLSIPAIVRKTIVIDQKVTSPQKNVIVHYEDHFFDEHITLKTSRTSRHTVIGPFHASE
jgi:hypothetical protein